MKNMGFYPADILIPRTGFESWSVVACDQFTWDPSYWKQVEEAARGVASTYHMIFPEAYLGVEDFEGRIASTNRAMEAYLKNGVLEEYPSSMVYVERALQDGSIRKGLVGMLDLEAYDYGFGSGSLVRATEGTVLERIPPRVRIRKDAALEVPHVMVLIDDPEGQVIEPCHGKASGWKKLYDFDLMMGGGNIKGYLVPPDGQEAVAAALEVLAGQEAFQAKYGVKDCPPFLYAVGDGNHSLAAAKECYVQRKRQVGEAAAKAHPARYALVELNNLHDQSLQFEAIHRAVFHVDPNRFISELKAYCQACHGDFGAQGFQVAHEGWEAAFPIPRPGFHLAAGSIQNFLDGYVQEHGGQVDYIHGEEEARRLAAEGAVSILLEPMEKSQLFKTVILEGALPRKTFSMGQAREKRYYLECRRIRHNF